MESGCKDCPDIDCPEHPEYADEIEGNPYDDVLPEAEDQDGGFPPVNP